MSWEKTEFKEYGTVIHAQFLNDLQDYMMAVDETATDGSDAISTLQTKTEGLETSLASVQSKADATEEDLAVVQSRLSELRYLRTYIGLVQSGTETLTVTSAYIVPNAGRIKVGDYVLSQNLVLTTVSAVATRSVTLTVITPFSERNGTMYVDFKNLTYDASGRITGGNSSETFESIKSAYESGKSIIARAGSYLIPMTQAILVSYFRFESTTLDDPSNPSLGYESWRITISTNGTISGFYREG